MCMGSAPKAAIAAAKLPEAPVAPDVAGSIGGDAESRRRNQAGAGGTILTGARGLGGTTSTGAGKTLLGS